MANSQVYSSILSSRAAKEIEDSWNWYEDRQEGLGDRFSKEVIDCIKKIELHPERYACRHKAYRETLIDIFPFLIIYRINKKHKTVMILSVFHASRNPKKKYRK